MKLASKLVPGVIALSLVIGSSMTVFANPSATAVPDTTHEEQYEVTNLTYSLAYEELYENNTVACEAIEDLNRSTDKSTETFVKAIVADTNEKAKASAEKIQDVVKNSNFLTGFFDIHVKDNEMMDPDELKKLDLAKSESGNFKVTLQVPALTENNKNPYVLHFSQERQEWEILWPTNIDYANKTLTIEFKDFSPASILAAADAGEDTKKTEEPETVTNDTTETATDSSTTADKKTTADDVDDDADDDDADDDDDDSSSGSSSAKSPKTGVADTWMIWLGASAILAGAARKRH